MTTTRNAHCGAQKFIGDLQGSEIARSFVVLPAPSAYQSLYPTPAQNGTALELLGANREKY